MGSSGSLLAQPLLGRSNEENKNEENEENQNEENEENKKTIFEEEHPLKINSNAKDIIETILLDAANNRLKLRKAVHSKCESPGSDEYKDIQKKLHNVVADFVRGENEECDSEKAGQLTDYIAQLIYLAPGSAGMILDLLLEKDKTTYYKRIKGVLMNDPMIALYHEVEAGNVSQEAESPEPKQGEPNVYEVTREKLVVPNVMDVDIIQALAYTDHVQIFAKKSVQAMLYAAWTPIMVPGTRIKTFLALVDLAALFAWGLTTAGGHTFDRLTWTTKHDSTNETWLSNHNLPANAWKEGGAMDHIYAYDSPRHVPSCWHVLAASFCRQSIDMACMIKRFIEKKRMTAKAEHKSLTLFWSWDAFFLMLWNTQPILLIFKGLFLSHTCGREKLVMTSTQQGMLCATVVFTLFALLSPFRVVACRISLSLIAMKKAIIQEDVLHFFAFITFIFLFYILAFEIIDREKTLAFGLVQGFRALIVGDGDGLDFLGLKTDDDTVKQQEAHRFRAAFGTLGMILFFSYLMQLLIAIFSNTYDDAVKNAWLHFHQARAQDLRDSILGHHKFRLNGVVIKCMDKLSMGWLFRKPQWHKNVTKCMDKLGAGWLLRQPYILSIGIVTFVIGILMQYGVHAIPQNDFHQNLYISVAIVSILLLTFGSVLMESSVFIREDIEKDWFPAYREVQKDQHRLLIFCRADYDEKHFLGDDEVEIRIDKVQVQLDGLLDKFGEFEKKLNKFGEIEEKLKNLFN